VVWAIMWYFLVYNSPAQHPRISAEEQQFIEKALNKTYDVKVVNVPLSGRNLDTFHGTETHTHQGLTKLVPRLFNSVSLLFFTSFKSV